MTLDESKFLGLAEGTLERLAEAIEDALGDELDVEMDGGILTIALSDGGQYIVNKNAPMRQIWLSSPRSGAWHFDWDEAGACWRSTRGQPVNLADLLAEELKAATGKPVAI